MDESVIYDYAHMRDPKEFRKYLKDRFDHQRDISLPLARDEWQSLRFQDFDKVMNYKFAKLGIVAKLRYCGETITKSQMLKRAPRFTKTTLLCNNNIGCVDIPKSQI